MSLFADYLAGLERGSYQGAYDEMFADVGAQTPRPHYKTLFARLAALSEEEFKRRVGLADATLMNQGITFTVYGDGLGVERTFPST
jgi:uncharacterized circularly permuted ATP-grasp superfamily protein